MQDDTNKPQYFVIDIQPEQKIAYEELLKEKEYKYSMAPMARARLTKINGKEIDLTESKKFSSREEETQFRMRRRGMNLSFREKISDFEKIEEGQFFSKKYIDGPVEISLEKRFAKRIGASLNDTLHFEFLGMEFESIITSIRSVNWTSIRPNFFVLVQPGFLDESPLTYISTIDYSDNMDYSLQGLMVKEFPNLSFVNIKSLSEKLSLLFAEILYGIKWMI